MPAPSLRTPQQLAGDLGEIKQGNQCAAWLLAAVCSQQFGTQVHPLVWNISAQREQEAEEPPRPFMLVQAPVDIKQDFRREQPDTFGSAGPFTARHSQNPTCSLVLVWPRGFSPAASFTATLGHRGPRGLLEVYGLGLNGIEPVGCGEGARGTSSPPRGWSPTIQQPPAEGRPSYPAVGNVSSKWGDGAPAQTDAPLSAAERPSEPEAAQDDADAGRFPRSGERRRGTWDQVLLYSAGQRREAESWQMLKMLIAAVLLAVTAAARESREACILKAVGDDATIPLNFSHLAALDELIWKNDKMAVFRRKKNIVTKLDRCNVMEDGSLKLLNLTLRDSGWYEAEVYGFSGTQLKRTRAQVCVLERVSRPWLNYTCDENVVLTCVSGGPSRPVTFSWTQNGNAVEGEQGASIMLPGRSGHGDVFSCTARNEVSAESSNTVSVVCEHPTTSCTRRPSNLKSDHSDTNPAASSGGLLLLSALAPLLQLWVLSLTTFI
ncbi:T-cell surface antigen CD2 [Arapaima gigas]